MCSTVNFVNSLNPNIPSAENDLLIEWPQWSSNTSAPPLLTFLDSQSAAAITSDTYRVDAMIVLNQLSAVNGI